jgi:hypothetical protein
MSESEATGKLIRMPGIVDAAATNPVQASGVLRLVAKGLRTGFFDVVELRIANNPMMQRVKKTLSLAFLSCKVIDKPAFYIPTNLRLIKVREIVNYPFRSQLNVSNVYGLID